MQELIGFLTLLFGFSFLVTIVKSLAAAHKVVGIPGGIDVSTGGYCLQVYDCNTIKCRLNDRDVVVKLHGIVELEDAHDDNQAQALAKEATGYLASRILNAWVTVIPTETDQYSRTVARVYIGNEDISMTMIKNGLSKTYSENLKEPFLTEYTTAEEEARRQRLGMWSM